MRVSKMVYAIIVSTLILLVTVVLFYSQNRSEIQHNIAKFESGHYMLFMELIEPSAGSIKLKEDCDFPINTASLHRFLLSNRNVLLISDKWESRSKMYNTSLFIPCFDSNHATTIWKNMDTTNALNNLILSAQNQIFHINSEQNFNPVMMYYNEALNRCYFVNCFDITYRNAYGTLKTDYTEFLSQIGGVGIELSEEDIMKVRNYDLKIF